MRSVGLAEFIDGEDVGMIERGSGIGFLLKAAQTAFIKGEFGGEHLEGDFALQMQVFGEVNLAHASGAETRDYFVMR